MCTSCYDKERLRYSLKRKISVNQRNLKQYHEKLKYNEEHKEKNREYVRRYQKKKRSILTAISVGKQNKQAGRKFFEYQGQPFYIV